MEGRQEPGTQRSLTRPTRRRFLGGLLLAAGAATPLLAACAPAPAPTATPAGAAAPASAPAPKPAEAPKPAAPAPAPAPTATLAPAPKPAAEAPKPTAAPAPAAKPAKSKESVELRFHMRGGGDKSEPAIYVDRPNEWSQETGHKVKLEPIVGDYTGKLMALAAGGAIGDLTFTDMKTQAHDLYVRSGILEPVDAFLGAFNVKKTEWEKPIIDYLTYEGKLYGLPKAGHPTDSYVYVNLKALQEAGIKKPEVYGNTLEDLASWANKTSKGPKDRRDVYGYFANVRNIMPVTNGVRRFGSDVVDKDGKTSLASSDGWYEWARWNDKLINEDRVHPPTEAIPQGGLEAMFAAEKLVMIYAQRSTLRPIRLAVKDKFPWMVIQAPRAANARGWGVSINTHTGTSASKHKEETFTLVYALADRRFAYLVAKEQGYLTGRVDNLEAIKELAEDTFLQLQYKNTQQGDPWWRAGNLRSAELETAIDNHMDLLWLGKRKLDKAFMAELKQSMDQILAKPSA